MRGPFSAGDRHAPARFVEVVEGERPGAGVDDDVPTVVGDVDAVDKDAGLARGRGERELQVGRASCVGRSRSAPNGESGRNNQAQCGQGRGQEALPELKLSRRSGFGRGASGSLEHALQRQTHVADVAYPLAGIFLEAAMHIGAEDGWNACR